MKRCKTIAVGAAVLSILLTQAAAAQSARPYAGLEARPIKALSDEQIADLRAGRGMGFALAAELNGYPGPLHVLELAQPLGLSATQQGAVKDLFDAMKAEAVPLGEALIAREAALDTLFAERTVTPENLGDATAAVGAAQAALRATHLKYHLATIKILTPQQVAHYAVLRGYAGSGHAAPAHRHGGHRH